MKRRSPIRRLHPESRNSPRAGLEAIQVVLVLAVAAIALLVVKSKWNAISSFFHSSTSSANSVDWTTDPQRGNATDLNGGSPTEAQSDNPPTRPDSDSTTAGDQNTQSLLDAPVWLIGVYIAIVGWATKEMLVFMRRRSEMGVLELLSDGIPRSYDEIIAATQSGELKTRIRCMPRRFCVGTTTDALAILVAEKRLKIDNRKYHVAKQSDDSSK